MISDEIRHKLQNIIRGELQQGESDSCTTILNLLCESFGTGPTVKSEFESRAIIKEDQVTFLKSHAQKTGLLMDSLPSGYQFLAEGAESKVFLSEDGRFVVKVNDAGYFALRVIIYNWEFDSQKYE